MKIRKHYKRKPTRHLCFIEKWCNGLPAWNGLVTCASTKSYDRIDYIKKMKSGTHLYISTFGFDTEHGFRFIQGVAIKVTGGVILADASEDDKVLYYVGYPCIAEWGRVKFVGNVDKFGAYDAINELMHGCNDIIIASIDMDAIYALSDLSKPWATLQEKVL